MTRSWLALWTIAAVLFGVLVVSILLLAKQYTFHCSLVNETSCPNPFGLLSDQAFSESAFTPSRGHPTLWTDVTDRFVVPVRRVVWKVEQEFVDADPMDGQNWGHFGDEKDETRWTAWDDIYDGARLAILTPICHFRMLILSSIQARGFRSSPTRRWAFLQGCQSRTFPSKQEDHGELPSTASLPASTTKFTVWYVVRQQDFKAVEPLTFCPRDGSNTISCPAATTT